MSREFDRPNYNPRYGLKNTGKVREEDFSIDGKSWDWRDPQNAEHIRRQRSGWTGRGGDPGAISNKAYTIANPLYDYDYGTVRDAAKALEIGNVDEQKEVDDILAYIQGGGGKGMKEEDTVQEPSEPPTFTPSEGHQTLRDKYESTRDNPTPRMSDKYGSDPYLTAIEHGDDLNDAYTKYTDAMKAEANLAGMEIGERTRFHLGRFAGTIPELGSGMKLYEEYADRLKDIA